MRTQCNPGTPSAEASQKVVDSSPIGRLVLLFMQSHEHWQGRASHLLAELTAIADEQERLSPRFPKDATRLSGQLRRLLPSLAELGVQIAFDRDRASRTIAMRRVDLSEEARIERLARALDPLIEASGDLGWVAERSATRKQPRPRSARRDLGRTRIRPREWIEATGMSVGATYRALYSGQLRAVQIGRSWFIDASELDEFFERQREAS